MTKEAILTVDFGTSNVRAALTDTADGAILYSICGQNHIYAPEQGYAQLVPEELWDNSVYAVGKVLEKAVGQKIHIAALAFSFFGDNLLLTDEALRPVTPLVLSFDTRGKPQILKMLYDMGYERIIRKIGSIPDWSSVPAKYLWLKENQPEVTDKAVYCFSNQQYILGRLGLDPVNDRTMAFRKSLLNLDTNSWDAELLSYVEIGEGMLGRIVESDEIIGTLHNYGSAELPYPVPVIPGAHDCSLGFAGLGMNGSTGKLMGNISGTFDHFGFFRSRKVMNEQILRQRRNEILTGCGCLKDSWIVMGAIPAYGMYLEWLVHTFFQDTGQETYEKLWRDVSLDGTQRLSIYPINTAEQGCMEGLEFSMSTADIFEAAVESLTFESRRVMELCADCRGERPEEIRIGGGTSRAGAWNQLRADVMGVPFACTQNVEASCMGAAILGAVSCGIYRNAEEAAEKMVRVTKTFFPDGERRGRYEEKYRSYLKKYHDSSF